MAARTIAQTFDLPGHTPPEQPESSAMTRMMIASFIRDGLRHDLKMAGGCRIFDLWRSGGVTCSPRPSSQCKGVPYGSALFRRVQDVMREGGFDSRLRYPKRRCPSRDRQARPRALTARL